MYWATTPEGIQRVAATKVSKAGIAAVDFIGTPPLLGPAPDLPPNTEGLLLTTMHAGTALVDTPKDTFVVEVEGVVPAYILRHLDTYS
jgi:hypothetical protein